MSGCHHPRVFKKEPFKFDDQRLFNTAIEELSKSEKPEDVAFCLRRWSNVLSKHDYAELVKDAEIYIQTI